MKRSFLCVLLCLLVLAVLPGAAYASEPTSEAVQEVVTELPMQKSGKYDLGEQELLDGEYPCSFFVPFEGLKGSKHRQGHLISFCVSAYSRGYNSGSMDERMYAAILDADGNVLCASEHLFSTIEGVSVAEIRITGSDELPVGTYYLYYFSTNEVGNLEGDPYEVHVVDSEKGNAILFDSIKENQSFSHDDFWKIDYTLVSYGFGGETYSIEVRKLNETTGAGTSGYFTMVPGEYPCTLYIDKTLEPGKYMIAIGCGYSQTVRIEFYITKGEGLFWELDGKTLTISGEGSMQDYTSGGQPWLKNPAAAEAIHVVNIDSGITYVGADAFRDLPNLSRVSIAHSVTQIGDSAFRNAPNLTTLGLPHSSLDIGNHAFRGSGLKVLEMPGTIRRIGKYAFADCNRLAKVTTDLTWAEWDGEIDDYAFANNPRLTAVEIPGSIRSMGSRIFDGSGEVRNVYFRDEAVTFAADTFRGMTLTAHYPSGISSWTKELMQNYGGQITWGLHNPALPAIELQQPIEHKTGIILQWNAVRHAKNYQIWRRESNSDEWSLIKTTGAVAYKDETALQGKGYRYKVCARNADRKSADSISHYAIRPYMLNNVTMTKIIAHGTGIIIHWEAVENAKFYQVYRRTNGQTEWVLLKNTGSLAYKDESAELGVFYTYKVRARNGEMMSSLNISGMSATRPYPLADVKMTRAQGHRTGNIIYWEAVEGAKFYQVYRLSPGASSWTLLKNTGSLAYKDETAEVGVKYQYRVRARNGDLMSSLNIKGLYVTRPYPLATVIITNKVGHTSGNILYWKAVDGACVYRIYRRVAHGTEELIATTGSLAYKDVTAVPGGTYYYRLVAVDSSGQTSRPTIEHSITRPRA